MSLESEYRAHAGACLKLAAKQVNSDDKARLLLMADAWLNLADSVAHRAGRAPQIPDHPLVKRLLEQSGPTE
jgi:hypothetical protein